VPNNSPENLTHQPNTTAEDARAAWVLDNYDELRAIGARQVMRATQGNGRNAIEDLTQESFAKAWRHFKPEHPNLPAWFSVIAANNAKDYMRRGYHAYESTTDMTPGVYRTDEAGLIQGPEEAFEESGFDLERFILKALCIANPEQAKENLELLRLYSDGTPTEEIVTTTGLNPKTVRKRIHRIRRHLEPLKPLIEAVVAGEDVVLTKEVFAEARKEAKTKAADPSS